jgi:hypothetical protein
MVSLAPFVVVPQQAISFGVPIIEPVFQSAWMMSSERHLPQNHRTQGTVIIYKAGAMKEYCSHMAYYTITNEIDNILVASYRGRATSVDGHQPLPNLQHLLIRDARERRKAWWRETR